MSQIDKQNELKAKIAGKEADNIIDMMQQR